MLTETAPPAVFQGARKVVRLESLFRELSLIHDLMIVCGEAARAPRSICDTELSNVLQRFGADQLYEHLKSLTAIIEAMGGETDFTERPEITTAGDQQ